MEFINSLLGSAMSDLANIIIYIIIIAIFIMGLVACIMPVLETRGRLKRAVRNIKAGQKAKKSWQEDDFLGKGTLMPHWSEYLNNLFFADGVYHNASNVEDYINEDTVIYGPGRSSFADAVPGLLVSIGFLGTLIGLAQGLSGFSMEDSAAVQQSIVTLIPGMRYAFMTSIFGVVGSVSFTLITRAVYGSTEHAMKAFYGAMSHNAGVLSVDPMTQIAIYQQEQTALIQTMAKELNGAFTDNMAAVIREAVEPINQNLSNFMTVTSKEQMRFLDAVVMRFVDRMDDAIGGQLQNFGQVLEKTAQNQQEAFAALRAGMAESERMVQNLYDVQRMSGSIVETMNACLQELQRYQSQSDEAFMRLTTGVEQMDLVSRQQTNYLKTVSAMQSEVSRSVETMTNVVNNCARRFSEENAAAAQTMQKAAGDLKEASAHIEKAQRDASRAMDEEMRATMDSYREYVNQFTQRVDYLAKSISDSLSKMPQAVAETADQFLDQIDRMSATLAQAQKSLDDAVDRMYHG